MDIPIPRERNKIDGAVTGVTIGFTTGYGDGRLPIL